MVNSPYDYAGESHHILLQYSVGEVCEKMMLMMTGTWNSRDMRS